MYSKIKDGGGKEGRGITLGDVMTHLADITPQKTVINETQEGKKISDLFTHDKYTNINFM
jgi:hypothetical protein